LVRPIFQDLDRVLQGTPDPPSWSLVEELVAPRQAEQLRRPEISQPLTTALQLCILAVLESWGIKPFSVVGHSSGEIAAACCAGFLDRHGAIKAAFFRGQAAVNCRNDTMEGLGMLAVGLSAKTAAPFLAKDEIPLPPTPAEYVLSNGDGKVDGTADDKSLQRILADLETIGAVRQIERAMDHTTAYLCSLAQSVDHTNPLKQDSLNVNIVRMTNETPAFADDIHRLSEKKDGALSFRQWPTRSKSRTQ
jgi:acyl transferase domain-containing protein